MNRKYFLIIFLSFFICPAFLFAEPNTSSSIIGQWADLPESPDDQTYRIVYKFEIDPNQKFSGSVINEDGSVDSTFSELTFKNGNLHYKWEPKPSFVLIFNGKISSDGMSVIGSSITGDHNTNTTLHRLVPNPYRSMDLKDLLTKVDQDDAKGIV